MIVKIIVDISHLHRFGKMFININVTLSYLFSKMSQYVDQIVNNRYNSGDIEFVELPSLKVDDNFVNNNGFDDMFSMNMEEIILDELKQIYKAEKIKITPKNYVKNVYLFNKVYEKCDIHFDIVDFFILFVECQSLDVRRLFNHLPIHYKREITEEMARRYGKKLQKKNTLF